jgi:hypothetical protein
LGSIRRSMCSRNLFCANSHTRNARRLTPLAPRAC